ncbi:Forkhead-associated domain-containing protein / FHA domain-containing protein [Hibiscus syriacus]|uniref:Forkhead-associated domain-containing protein / FHA domain-containing protein n=1 Tax=Hibiscus syriacus TaxID=106335 RepID=A0A6A2ZTC4_HIBSY|nr:Forkhead-associated domain-containing protein / FHA domain-containing protein [Hibiscus syriacus]
MFSSAVGSPVDSLRLEPDRPYTIGRANASCDFAFGNRRRLMLSDDEFEVEEKAKEDEVLGFCRVRVSLNGVYVNGVKVKRGRVRELFAGDEVLLVCGNESKCSLRVQVGFFIQGIVFKEETVTELDEATGVKPRSTGAMVSSRNSQGTVSSRKRNKRVYAIPANEMSSGWEKGLKSNVVMGRVKLILKQISGADINDGMKFAIGSEEEVSSISPFSRKELQSPNKNDKLVQSSSFREVATSELNRNLIGDVLPSNLPVERALLNAVVAETSNISAPGKMFYLNRLSYPDCGSSSHDSVVSLRELLYPVESISKMFIATFTNDISWFLLHCEIPCHLPVTIACHNAERCWNSSLDARTSRPLSDFPNLVVVFPPFPEVIAFGNDLKKQGIACHHPKLFVLQREDSIRVVITSANLVAKQWESVTNTVWWQDFPRRREPDCLSLFSLSGGERSQNSRSDFAAQLAGFMASLIVDVPSQSHWIVALTNYDFTNATGHLVASIPGIHSDRTLKANQFTPSSLDVKFLGLVEASVVGLGHLFCTTEDKNGAKLKKLALFLGKTCENANGMLNVVLRRNTNISVDENAVSVLVRNPDNLSAEDCIQLGFLPRNVAKWVSPLWDMGFFEFHGYVYREEALTATFGGNNKKVQLILHVSQAWYSCYYLRCYHVIQRGGPSFLHMSKMMPDQNIAALCYLIASVQRCTGLWRLQEVLGQYNWPESQESDFIYGASSIGSSVSAPFLAAFAASVGKKSSQFFDSEESDPEWGCWTASQELINPSVRIIFPTIERVKRSLPSPSDRVEHPMHVKVARRRFWSTTSSSSFGWVYCGSHNFSAAAWGRPISSSSRTKANGLAQANSFITSRLHICNYELGIIFVFPPMEAKCIANQNQTKLDDVALPFVVPAPKYGPKDRPATALAMRDACAEHSELEANNLAEVAIAENMMEDVPDDDEEVIEATNYVVEDKEEDKTYAEKLWSQVDSSQSS